MFACIIVSRSSPLTKLKTTETWGLVHTLLETISKNYFWKKWTWGLLASQNCRVTWISAYLLTGKELFLSCTFLLLHWWSIMSFISSILFFKRNYPFFDLTFSRFFVAKCCNNHQQYSLKLGKEFTCIRHFSCSACDFNVLLQCH